MEEPDKTKEKGIDEKGETGLPVPVTHSEKVKTKADLQKEKKLKKKYPGNAEGGKVLSDEDGKVYDQSLVWALSKTCKSSSLHTLLLTFDDRS